MSGSLEVRPDLVRSGVSAYESANAQLDSAVQRARGGILGVDPAGIFGGDEAGRTARANYEQAGGPAELLFGAAGGGGVVAALGTGGPAVTQALNDVLAQEAANAAGMGSVGGSAPA